ncbi:unnamed protein product [Rhizophagus irregularis]|nr:unnamed protein product [Rhizophagus irregularis]
MDLKMKDDEREENLVKKEGVSIKPVTPVELHEYNTVNASCLTRLSYDNLQIKEEKNFESEEGCVKEGKKRILGKQGDRSIAEEHDRSIAMVVGQQLHRKLSGRDILESLEVE